MSTQIHLENTTILSLSENWNYISSIINNTRVNREQFNFDDETEESIVFELPQLQITSSSIKLVKN